GRNRNGVAGAVRSSGGHLVLAGRPLGAVVAFAVPAQDLVLTSLDGIAVAVDGLTSAVGNGDADIRVGRNTEIPGGRAVCQQGRAAIDDRGFADERQRLRRL